MVTALHTYSWRALPVWLVAIAALLYGADEPLASLALFWPAAFLTIGVLLFGRPVPTFPETALFCVFAMVAGIHVWTGRWPVAAPEFAALAFSLALLFVVPRLARTRAVITKLFDLILVLGAILAFFAFLDFVTDTTTQWGQPKPYHSGRLSTPFLSANTAATFYGALVILAMARLLCAVRAKPPSRQSGDRTGHRLKTLIIPVSTLILCGSDLFLTASRAGISLAMSGVILLLIWDGLAHWRQSGGAAPPSQRNLPWLFPLIACLLGLLFMMSGTLYASRLDLDGLGMGNRAQAFAAYWEALRLRPVFGDGLGSFAYTNDLIATASQAEVRQLQGAAHNVLLQWGLQAGIAGTVAMLIVWSGLWEGIRRGLRMRRRQRTELRAVLVIMLVVAAHGMVDYALEIPAMSGLLALLIGLARAILWRRQGR